MFRTVIAVAFAWPLFFAVPASAGGPLTVEDARARVLLPSRPGVAWLTIRNTGGADDRLIGAESPVAARIELHTHIHGGGVMMMRKVENIDLPARGAAALEPGGDHLMLFGLETGLSPGDHFPLTLLFERAEPVTVDVRIAPLAETTSKHKHE
ncbi:MAG: copper chaperone PCu(A)C [Alphaproteobacteria bacterium]|nr:copper chaperone PCu(A)C [Alphaproteobacteria bacterium]MCY4318867.1 copper chaperone PCu(A)C [Alphaproteobacteria bacterium]